MGFFSNIKHKQIRSFTKGACRAMLFAFGIAEAKAEKGKLEAKMYSDLAAKALSTRPGWKMIEQNLFEHKSGEKLQIEKEHNLVDVILSVVLIEMEEFVLNDNNPEEIRGLITDEFTKFFSAIPEDEIGAIVKRNPEWIRMLGAVTMRKMGYGGLK